MPRAAVGTSAELLTRLPLPEQAAWLHALRTPVLMRTERARRLLRWRPRHTAAETLDELIVAQRAQR